MIIVSQNREVILNMDLINALTIYFVEEGKYRVLAYTGTGEDDCYGIGDYQTKERCKEILEEIRNKYGSYLHRKGGQAILRGSIDIPEDFWVLPKVYDMPEK